MTEVLDRRGVRTGGDHGSPAGDDPARERAELALCLASSHRGLRELARRRLDALGPRGAPGRPAAPRPPLGPTAGPTERPGLSEGLPGTLPRKGLSRVKGTPGVPSGPSGLPVPAVKTRR